MPKKDTDALSSLAENLHQLSSDSTERPKDRYIERVREFIRNGEGTTWQESSTDNEASIVNQYNSFQDWVASFTPESVDEEELNHQLRRLAAKKGESSIQEADGVPDQNENMVNLVIKGLKRPDVDVPMMEHLCVKPSMPVADVISFLESKGTFLNPSQERTS